MLHKERRREEALAYLTERARVCGADGWCTVSLEKLREVIAVLAFEDADHKLLEKARSGRVLKWHGGGVVVFNSDWYTRHKRREGVKEERDE